MARLYYRAPALRNSSGAVAANVNYVVYSDSAGTTLADISATSGGSSISGSTVTTSALGLLEFWGPSAGTTTLYVRCPAQPSLGVQRIDANADDRLDALEAGASGIAATIFDAKGDIIAASAADTAARLAVGSNGQVLTAASGQATGLQWATPSVGSGGIAETLLDAKGDLVAASAADTAARLAVGANGQGLVSDSAATTGLKWLDPPVYNVKAPPYNAVGDGVTDDTATIQAAIDAADAARGGTVFFPSGAYLITTLTMKSGVSLVGTGTQHSFPQNGPSALQGTAGSDMIDFPSTTQNVSIQHLGIRGGRRGINSLGLNAIHVYLDHVVFASQSDACVYVEGSIERWRFRNCFFSGGDYGFRHANVAVSSSNYLDKCDFIDCVWTGQTLNAVKITVNLGNTVTWVNPIFNSSEQHSVWLDGGLRSFTFINANFEINGFSGKKNRTTLTGTVTSGATSGTLASATGWATGDTITIAGAGASGADFSDTVTISGTTATWTTPTSTTVAAPKVTNAIYDDVFLASSVAFPTRISFVGGIIGGEGLGKLRYSVNNSIGADVGFFEAATGSEVPVYDPSMRCTAVGGAVDLRQPATLVGRVPLGIATSTTATNTRRGYLSSPPGGDLDLFLVDSTIGSGGTVGTGALRVLNANRDAVLKWGWDGTNRQLGFYNTNPQTKPTVTGNRGANPALADLLADLATLGLVTDSTTAGAAVVPSMTVPSAPASGSLLYFDSADSKTKVVNAAGDITVIG